MTKLTKNQRYHLHRKLKGIYRVEAKKRTVYVPVSEIITNTVKQQAILNQLCGGGV